jgi:hypothetical protein
MADKPLILKYISKHYSSIMPLLLNVLRNADGGDYRKLRVKAMECAGLIGMFDLNQSIEICLRKSTLKPSLSVEIFFDQTPILSLSCSCEYRVCSHRMDVLSFLRRPETFLDSPPDPDDTLLGHYMIATWAKICQAMGPEFEPYLPVVMPPLLAAASAKADVSVYGTFVPLFFASM